MASTNEFLRFLITGGINTLVTYVIYLLLLKHIPYDLAYAIAYGIGIAVAYGLNTVYVFRRPLSRRSALRFPLIYVAQFILGLVLLSVAVEILHVPRWLALGFAVVLTLPVTFVLSRVIVRAG